MLKPAFDMIQNSINKFEDVGGNVNSLFKVNVMQSYIPQSGFIFGPNKLKFKIAFIKVAVSQKST